MSHSLISIKNLSINFSSKICFENFSVNILNNCKIALIGRNGCGKSSLLKAIAGLWHDYEGQININDNAILSYVPQSIEDHQTLSGGQRFIQTFDNALKINPDILLLDEPTNHLDATNRTILFREISRFKGLIITASHDKQIINNCDYLWHIESEKIHVFSGNYEDYIKEINIKRHAIEKELRILNANKKEMHNKLMQEQSRAASSKTKGNKNYAKGKWDKMTRDFTASKAEKSQGKKLESIENTKQKLGQQLQDLRLPEIIVPKFSIKNDSALNRQIILQITNGSFGYKDEWILSNINIFMDGTSRIAIRGNNGCGKSTLIKAIMDDPIVKKTGEWITPQLKDIGFLDQHYSDLNKALSVFETISNFKAEWSYAAIRRHLNDFLFRTNEEVNNLVENLSGGEKARLVLSLICAKMPKLLILDEVTNNLDLETKEHVINVLKDYPGALLVISHDEKFLTEIGVSDYYDI